MHPTRSWPLVFGNGNWIFDGQDDRTCSTGGSAHLKFTAVYPLPTPPQDPITLLTGHGHAEATGCTSAGDDFEDKFVRTGD